MVDVMRGGPGLGNISPSQADYNQIIHGGGHGDYHAIVLAPASVQESIDLTVQAFDLAEKYRAITVVLTDGNIGQMMEPAELPAMQPLKTQYPSWAARGAHGDERHVLSSIYMAPPEEEAFNFRLANKWRDITSQEIRYKEYFMDDARLAVVGFGSSGRVALTAVRAARAEGIPVGLIRPITLSPYPEKILDEVSRTLDGMLVVEMNAGQMLNDVQRITQSRLPIEFYGRLGGVVPFPDEILAEIRRMAAGPLPTAGNPRDRWLDRMAKMN
jgi:2-oxoglutarate ferredoxin oxidoreductase subunit alpha